MKRLGNCNVTNAHWHISMDEQISSSLISVLIECLIKCPIPILISNFKLPSPAVLKTLLP